MARPHLFARTRFAALCWVMGAWSCTDLASRGEFAAGYGGQSGDGSGNHGGQTGDGAGIAKVGTDCPHDSTPWDGGLDEQVPDLDVTPEQVIEYVEGRKEYTFGWLTNDRLEAARTATQVTVELRYDGGAIAVRKPASAPTEGRQEASNLVPPQGYLSLAAAHCDTLLTLEFEARIRTKDGALDETFPVLITANQQGAAHFEGWLPKQLSGTLADQMDEADGRLYVAAMFTPWGNSGELVFIPHSDGEHDGDEGDVPASERIASWPVLDASLCEDAAYGRVLTELVPSSKGGTLAELFDTLAPKQAPLTWTTTPAWPDACSSETLAREECNTTLHMEPRVMPDVWCVTLSPFEPNFSAVGALEVGLNTADGKWRGTYDALAHLNVNPEGVNGAGITMVQQSIVTSGETFGFPDVALVPGSEANLVADVYAEQGSTFGSLGFVGYAAPVDDDEASSQEEPGIVTINASIGDTK